jgi:hypothetical protein
VGAVVTFESIFEILENRFFN